MQNNKILSNALKCEGAIYFGIADTGPAGTELYLDGDLASCVIAWCLDEDSNWVKSDFESFCVYGFKEFRSLTDIRTIVALEKKAQAGQENVKYWATQFNELRSQFDEMQKRAEAAEAQASRVQELEQQKDTLETELLALTMATGRHETWELGKQLFKDFQVSNFNKGVQACIEELERCHEVTLKENKDFEGARDIEVLIDHLHQVEKDDA